MRRNVRRLIPLNLVSYLSIWFSLYVLYFQGVGLTLGEIGLIMAIGRVVFCVANIPAGQLADYYGYRRCLLIGGGLMMAAFVGMAVGGGFWVMLAWIVVFDLGAALDHGADMGLVKISLSYLESADASDGLSFKRFSSLNTAVITMSQAVGGLAASGLILLFDTHAPHIGMWLQAGVFLLGLGVARLLTEPPRSAEAKEPLRRIRTSRGWARLRRIRTSRGGARRGRPEIYWGVLYLAAVTALLTLPYVIQTQTIQSLGHDEIWIGITLTGWLVIAAITSLLMKRYGAGLKSWLVLKWLLPLALAAISAFVLLPGNGIIVGAALSAIGGAMVRLISAPFLTELTTKYATIISAYTSLSSLMIAASLYGMNVVIERWSVRGAFLVGLVVFGIISCLALGGLSRALRMRRA